MNSVDTTPMTLFLFVFELRFFLAAVGFLLIPFERNFEIDGLYKLVFIRKRPFSAVAASIRRLACAAYRCTPPRKPLISLPQRKIARFPYENYAVSIRKLRMKTSYKDDKFCLPKLRI